MDEYKCLSCHLVGLNPYVKKKFTNNLNEKIFNVIDLDIINQEVLKNQQLDKMYQQYQKLKNDKNDKYKEVDKKMSQFWEKNFINNIEEQISQKKINILVGQNNHYKSLNKRVNIDCTNKFILKSDTDEEVKAWIKYNIDNYREEIIHGNFPLDYINYDFLYKKKLSIESIYKKIGYIEKSLDQINTIINLIESSTKKTSQEIWVSMKEPYNVGSLIHPKVNESNKITGYSEPNIALLDSINFTNGEGKKTFDGDEIILKEMNTHSIKKLKTRRFLYLVDSKTFIPHEMGNGKKFFSQVPVKVLAKEKIDNVYEYFIGSESE